MCYKLHHLGAEHCVTGSCHLLQLESGMNIMVDCGLAQGLDTAKPIFNWPVSPSEIDYLFITHAHLDHIGRIPELIEQGFDGEIICSHPTKKLMMPMLRDAMAFSDRPETEVRTIGKKIDELSWGFEFLEKFSLKKNVRFSLGNAGHILGSSFIRFEIPLNGNEKNYYSVVFSGDLGNRNTPIVPDPDIPEPCDLLILESTYGNRLHEGRQERNRELSELLQKAFENNGKVFIPSFALGRTQELLYEIDRIVSDEKLLNLIEGIKKIPVFIDSPLGLEITKLYSEMKDFWDNDSRKRLEDGDHPFDFDSLYAVENYLHHRKLLEIESPAIIIAGSGMCTGGRILNHLEHGLDDEKNDVFFIGYQSEGTPGRDIIRYSKRQNGYIWLNKNKIKIKAGVYKITGFSAHADRDELLHWVNSIAQKPSRIKLVHGDPGAKSDMKRQLIDNGYKVE